MEYKRRLSSIIRNLSAMKFLIVSFLFLAAIAGALGIIGGKNAKRTQFPYMVGIMAYSNNISIYSFCGGSLITNQWVLTSATCTFGAVYAKVYLGSVLYRDNSTSYTVGGNFIITHKDYNRRTAENDISLIMIPFTSYSVSIKNIKLPRATDRQLYTDVLTIATGWGMTAVSAPMSPILKFANFFTLSNEECKHTYPVLKETQLCVKTTGNLSPCDGDGGGPLAYYSRTDGLIQIGITSFVTGTVTICDQGAPFGYTRISEYLQWIKRKTGIPVQGMNPFVNVTAAQ